MSILITGAGRRLGLTLVEHFLAQGEHVTAVTRGGCDELHRLKLRFEHELAIEVISNYSIEGLEALIGRLGQRKFSLLINNASMFEDDQTSSGVQAAYNQFTHFFDVHMAFPALLGDWFYTQYAPTQDGQSGLIINITDIYVANPKPGRAFYSATKAGLENLTLSQAKEYAPKLRVNSIQPGTMKFLPEHDEQTQQQVLAHSLFQYEAGFTPLVQAIEYLMGNSFVTGTALKVDGGRSLAR
ncbi:SDR family NAD(P)-dependent oxidoreductase [Alteromonas facilis]|uniref:SDR family NAD(P)-dependent oxidoreductase n=1 Tax=Alteromonas facilis TaxID=2048004 RepID=UPI0013DBFFFF|nr:SDR family NAD(P)-dependent oxidoreductase [Alteromonas facilis]